MGRDIRRAFWLKEGRSAFDKDFIDQIGQDEPYLEFCRKSGCGVRGGGSRSSEQAMEFCY